MSHVAPDYCQSAVPLYALASTAAILSMYYVRLTVKDGPKHYSPTYGIGAALFLALAAGISARALTMRTKTQMRVDEMYNDVYLNSREMNKPEKIKLSALVSQAKYGDAPVTLYSYLTSLSQAIAGFGHVPSPDADSHSTNWQLWSEMRGLPKSNATQMLADYACTVFRRLRTATTPASVEYPPKLK